MKPHGNLLSWALLISNGIVTALFSPLANLHLIFFLSGVSFPVIDETIFAKCKKKATTLLKLDSPQIFPSSGSERIHIVAWKPFEKSQCLVPFRNWNEDYRNKKYRYHYKYEKTWDYLTQQFFFYLRSCLYMASEFAIFWLKGFRVNLMMGFYTIN